MQLRPPWLNLRTQFASLAVTEISHEPCVNASMHAPAPKCVSRRAQNLAFLQMVAIHGDKLRESHQGVKAFKGDNFTEAGSNTSLLFVTVVTLAKLWPIHKLGRCSSVMVTDAMAIVTSQAPCVRRDQSKAATAKPRTPRSKK